MGKCQLKRNVYSAVPRAGISRRRQTDPTGLRAGVYRNSDLSTQFTAVGPAGYSGEVSLDYRIGREWTVGVGALRDARLNDTNVGPQVDRDVVQLRLTWERFQPF